MSRKPFEEMEKRLNEMVKEGPSGGGSSISIRTVGGETKVDVSGDVSDGEIRKLKEKYPGTEIRIEGKNSREKEKPVIEVIDEDNEKK